MSKPTQLPKTDAELWATVINQSGMIAQHAKQGMAGKGFNIVEISRIAQMLNCAALELASRKAGNAPKKITS